jgi:aspartate/methionine/tyrosine aminotransferase
VPTSAVLPVPGGRTAISLLGTILVRAGDRVVTTTPGYPVVDRVAAWHGAEVTAVSLDAGAGFSPRLEQLPGPGDIRLLALNYPNNPTGAVLAPDHLAELMARVAPTTVVFNDASYGPLTYGARPWSLLGQAAATSRGVPLLELYSLSKLYGVGAIPVAFLVGEEERIAAMRQYSEFAWSDPSALLLRVAMRCLDDTDHLDRTRTACRERLARLDAVVRTLGFAPYPVDAGMYLLCRGPHTVAGTPVTTAAAAADLLLDRFGLAVIPFDVSDATYLRFSASYLEEDLDAAGALASAGPIVAG